MKVYKIYSKGCTNPNPIKDVTYMEGGNGRRCHFRKLGQCDRKWIC